MDEPQSGSSDPTDDKLMNVLATQGIDSAPGRAAMETFFQRHCLMLGKACLRFVHGRNRDDRVRDLVDDTFLRAAERASTYHANGATTAEQITRNTHRWLRMIAFHLYLDKRNTDSAMRALLPARAEDDRVADLPCPDGQNALSPPDPVWQGRIRRAATALAKLSERDRNILVVSLDWFNRETQEFNVPPDIAEDLCGEYGITQSNCVTIRHRAFKKVTGDFAGDTACVA